MYIEKVNFFVEQDTNFPDEAPPVGRVVGMQLSDRKDGVLEVGGIVRSVHTSMPIEQAQRAFGGFKRNIRGKVPPPPPFEEYQFPPDEYRNDISFAAWTAFSVMLAENARARMSMLPRQLPLSPREVMHVSKGARDQLLAGQFYGVTVKRGDGPLQLRHSLVGLNLPDRLLTQYRVNERALPRYAGSLVMGSTEELLAAYESAVPDDVEIGFVRLPTLPKCIRELQSIPI